MGPGLNTK